MIDGVAVGAQQADKIGDQPKGGVEGARSVICEPMWISTPVT